MYYTIYKVTNKINGKFYIGSHKTKNLDDNYMGSGKYLKRSIEKHGIENFEKEILFVFDNPDDMYAKEKEIVNKDFLAEENTYNLKVGGFGGFDYINENNLNGFSDPKVAKKGRRKTDSILEQKYGYNWRYELSKKGNNALQNKKKCPEYSEKLSRKLSEIMSGEGNPMFGKNHSFRTKKLMSEKQCGNKNSQYGSRWIHSIDLKCSKRIKKDEPLPKGWIEGRKIKF